MIKFLPKLAFKIFEKIKFESKRKFEEDLSEKKKQKIYDEKMKKENEKQEREKFQIDLKQLKLD